MESKKQLELAGAKILGVVLNKIDKTDSSYYGKHYYYKYSSAYGYGKASEES
jgi:Mrp family chromosome partitioning ATPase